jgi:hypothetical protein
MNIACSAFTKLKDDELSTFADVVYTKMKDKPIYAPFQTLVTDLLSLKEAYNTAYVDAKGGGDRAIRIKGEARLAVESQLTRIAKRMDSEWTDDSHDFEKKEAGYTLVKIRDRQTIDAINAPKNVKAVNNERHGVVDVTWTPVPKAKTYAIEVLGSDGVWKNGIYSDRPRYQFTNLERGSQLTIRIKTIGPNTITSEWTEPVSVFVD